MPIPSASSCANPEGLFLDYLPFARPTIDEAMIAAVADTLRGRWIASGPHVLAFEKALGEYVGGRPVRVLTSATGAMQVALELIDVEPASRNMDLAQAGAAVTSKTKALLPTHYNAPIDPDALAALARRHRLRV